MGAVVVGQIAPALGWAGVVPWSIPAVAAGLPPGSRLDAVGIAVALWTGLIGVLGTVAWRRSGRVGA